MTSDMFQDFLRGAARNVGADGVDRCAAQLFAIIGGASQDAGISSQMDLPLGTHEAATSLISAFFAVRRRWRCAPFRSQDPDTPNRRCTPSSPPTPPPTREQTSPSSAFHASHCGRTSSPPSDATDAFLADARRRLAAVQRLHSAGDAPGLRAEARSLAAAAAAAGSRSVAAAAAALCDRRSEHAGETHPSRPGEPGGAGPVRRGAVDGLEVQLDAAYAIWRSCRTLV
jgi:hypothetical protein